MFVPSPPLRAAIGSGLAAIALLGLAACSGTESEPGGASSPQTSEGASEGSSEGSSESPTQDGAPDPIEITIADGGISPNGVRLEVPVGEPVTLVITADVAGSLHVHSTPEQEIEYSVGTTEHEVRIDRPGVVEVESHDPTLVVLQLEAR